MNDLQDIVDRLSDAFSDLNNHIRGLPENERRRYMNPECLGGFSCFLGLGNGYEPAYYNSGRIDDLLENADEDLSEE